MMNANATNRIERDECEEMNAAEEGYKELYDESIKRESKDDQLKFKKKILLSLWGSQFICC